MKIRYMILALASLFALGFLTVITYFAAFAVTFMTGNTAHRSPGFRPAGTSAGKSDAPKKTGFS